MTINPVTRATATVKPIRVEMKFRNNFILTKMDDLGIKSLSELSKKAQCNNVTLCELVAMKISALKPNGEWRTIALLLSDFFRCLPEDLFSNEQKFHELKKNTLKVEAQYFELEALSQVTQATPEQILQAKELKEVIFKLLLRLTPREQRVLTLRFGLNGEEEKSLEDIAAIWSVGRERIRQIEDKAFRKLRSSIAKKSSLRSLFRSDDGITDLDTIKAVSQS